MLNRQGSCMSGLSAKDPCQGTSGHHAEYWTDKATACRDCQPKTPVRGRQGIMLNIEQTRPLPGFIKITICNGFSRVVLPCTVQSIQCTMYMFHAKKISLMRPFVFTAITLLYAVQCTVQYKWHCSSISFWIHFEYTVYEYNYSNGSSFRSNEMRKANL